MRSRIPAANLLPKQGVVRAGGHEKDHGHGQKEIRSRSQKSRVFAHVFLVEFPIFVPPAAKKILILRQIFPARKELNLQVSQRPLKSPFRAAKLSVVRGREWPFERLRDPEVHDPRVPVDVDHDVLW